MLRSSLHSGPRKSSRADPVQQRSATDPPAPRPLAAAFWMLGGVACFTLLAIAGRAVAPAHDTFEIMLYRSMIGLSLVLAAAAALRLPLRRGPLGLHLARNVAHFTGQNLWFYAITVLPLAQVFALEFTTPIWVLLLSPLLLAERITRRGALAASLGFAGILIVARPDGTPDPGLIAAALCAVGFALSVILTKRLTRTEPLIAILFWLNLMQLVLALVSAGADGDIALPDEAALPWLGLIGVAGLLAHVCLTRALQLAPAATVMPVDFLRLPVIALVGVAIYDEPIEAFVLLGGALILLANWINLARRGNEGKSARMRKS
jgi:drug/metabolite transporter (DMT)-like permease